MLGKSAHSLRWLTSSLRSADILLIPIIHKLLRRTSLLKIMIFLVLHLHAKNPIGMCRLFIMGCQITVSVIRKYVRRIVCIFRVLEKADEESSISSSKLQIRFTFYHIQFHTRRRRRSERENSKQKGCISDDTSVHSFLFSFCC